MHLVHERPAISLFSGAGGLDLGVEQAGFRVRAAVEHDRDACTTLRANFGHAEVLQADIRRVETKDLLFAAGLRAGEPELLIGGPPCTPFSKSGNWIEQKRRGLDPEASLLEHYVRIVDEARPRMFVLENVFALAYSNHNRPWLEFLLESFDALGYRVAQRSLLAADYGVPQRRQRLIIVGSLDGTPALPDPTHTGPHERRIWTQGALASHVTAGEALADLVARDDLAEPEEVVGGKYGHLLPEIPAGDNYLHFTAKRGHPAPLFEWRRRYWSFLLKLDPAQPSPTIQAQPGPYVGPFHWENRRLRTIEIKRLQTFPDSFAVSGSRRSVQKQIGNAVPPLLARRIAEALLTGEVAVPVPEQLAFAA
ncbi:MAG TPA: DNA cytosine methyltransferase [Solirubrobacteraceae bacterium]|jgi:DNA (cytosine-5)-methyltransferase 1